MPLTVLNVAFPLASVGPDAVGGAEQVLSLLDRSLVAAGHRSIVIASEGSRVSGRHVATPRQEAPLDDAAWARAHDAHRAAIRRALDTWTIDVVHLHGVDYDHYLPPPGPPVLVTLHLPATHYASGALAPRRPRTFLHCVSASQRRLFSADVPLLEDVPNGVALDAYRPARRRRAYALALGRICESKGFHLALDAAAQADVPFLLAGMVQPFPAHLRYFAEQIRPRLGDARRFVGVLRGARKRRLLAAARCVVVSSLVPETCSLAALEALASGTPVVAFRRGALPEVVEHGETGFLVDDVGQMAAAMRACGAIPPERCRAAAERRFSSATTVRRYLELYERLAAGLTPPARARPARPPPAPASAVR